MAGPKDLIAQIILRLKDEASRGLDVARDRVRGVGQEVDRVKQLAVGLFSIAALKQGIESLTNLSDKYASLTGRIKQTIGPTGDLLATQRRLYDISQRTNIPLEGTVQLYARSAQALKNLNNGQEIAAKLAETVNLSFKAQSSGAAEISSTITQLTQSLATNEVQWEDFGQLADTNLMLVNVAAKRLGYDGIGSLKQAMSDGLVSNIELVNAIVSGFDEIKAAADTMPTSVASSWTKLENRMLLFIGQSDKARDTSAKLAGVISGVADNFNTIAGAALLAAEAYGVKLLFGLTASTKAFLENVLAVRQKAIADQQAAAAMQIRLQWEAKQAQISAQNSVLLIKEAQLQMALAATEHERTVALIALNAAYAKNQTAVAASIAKNAALSASSATAATSTGLLSKAFAALNRAFVLFLVVDVAVSVAEWARQFEVARIAAINLTQGFVLLTTAFADLFIPKSAESKLEQIRRINEAFEKLRQNVHAGFIADQETQHAEAVVQANEKIQASLSATEKAYESFFTNLESFYQREQEAIDQRQQQQTLALEKSVTDEQERARQVTDVIIAANQQRIQLANTYASERIRILESIYNKEIEKVRSSGQSVAQIEQQLLTKKLAILKTLEDATKQAIERMIAEEQRHVQAAQAAAEQRKNLAISTEEAILGFLRGSMNEQQKVRSFSTEQEELQASLRKARAAGDFEEQQRISKRLMDLAFERGNVERQIAEQNGQSAITANARAVDSYREAAQAGQEALKGMQTAEEAAAAKSHNAAAEATKTLEDLQSRITKMQDALSKGTASTHSITDNVDEVMARIKRLDGVVTKSEHIVVEKVQREGQSAPAQSDQAPVDVPQARQTGGPIYALERGGSLPGWGGGDIVDAKLEPGEFVMRKEAVAKYGQNFFARLNAMKAGAVDVIRRRFGGIIPGFAVGGSINGDVVENEKERRKLRLEAAVAESARQQAVRDQLRSEVDELKKKIAEVASTAQYTFSRFGRGFSRPHSSDAGLDALLEGASRASFGGGAGKYLDGVNNAVQALVFKLRKAKLTFDDLPIRGAFNVSIGKSDLGSQVGKLFADGVKKFSRGGIVPGVGDSDSVSAMLTPGEGVIKKASVQKYGRAFIDAINQGVLPKGFNAAVLSTPPPAASASLVVQFKAPEGQTAQAHFASQSDVNQFLEVIKLSGGVTA